MSIKPFKNKIWLASPTMHGDEQKFVKEAFDTNWVSTVGKNLERLEQEICSYVGCTHAVALSAGTAALHLAVKLAGIKKGDKVLCSDLTFAATVNPVSYEQGIQVFIDSERDTWNMDPAALERAFQKYPDAKAVIAANLYGTPAKLSELRDICRKYHAVFIEDAAESLGSTFKGRMTGTFGHYGIYSFNGNKIITTSGGGMLVSRDEAAVDKARFLSTQARDPARHYQHSQIGFNYRMSNVLAGIGRGQLLHLEEHKAKKKEIYRQYREAFAEIGAITMNPMNPDGDANNWLSGIVIDPASGVTPDQVMDALADENIESRPVWKPMHMQPVFEKEDFITLKESGSVGEEIFRTGVCLPSDIKNTPEDMERIIHIIKGLF